MDIIKIKLSDSIHYKESDIDLSDIRGTNCYCDDSAMEEIEKRLKDVPLKAIHFIDSGNYHYMTLPFLKKIKEDFSLVVFDNHTDYKENAYSLIACGGWIKIAENSFKNLKNIYIIGVDEKLLKEDKFSDKVFTDTKNFLNKIKDEAYPIYISIDEDVMTEIDYKANWSQGVMKKEELLSYIEYLFKNKNIIGVDICGGTGNLYDTKGNEKNQNTENLIVEKINSLT